MAVLATSGFSAFSPYLQPASAAGCVIAAAGDIAQADNNSEGTAKLVEAAAPTAVLALGDLAYENGTSEEFKSQYDPTWGRFKDITKPTPGNHEYQSSQGDGYYAYFPGTQPYYAFDVCGWHMLSLNSEIDTAAQVDFVKAEATKAAGKPILAFWHQPRYSSGSTHGSNAKMQSLYDAVANAGAKIILNGHEHLYERFAPTDGAGAASQDGVTEFVIGTGGASTYDFGSALPNSQKRIAHKTGIGVFNLRPDGYDFEFRQTNGTVGDSGNVAVKANTSAGSKVPAKKTPAPVPAKNDKVPPAPKAKVPSAAGDAPAKTTTPVVTTSSRDAGEAATTKVSAQPAPMVPVQKVVTAPAAAPTQAAPAAEREQPVAAQTLEGSDSATLPGATTATATATPTGQTLEGSDSATLPGSETDTPAATPLVPTASTAAVTKPTIAAGTPAGSGSAAGDAETEATDTGSTVVNPSVDTTPAMKTAQPAPPVELAHTGIDAALLTFFANLLLGSGLTALWYRDRRCAWLDDFSGYQDFYDEY